MKKEDDSCLPHRMGEVAAKYRRETLNGYARELRNNATEAKRLLWHHLRRRQ
jgi:very-short-patch-repair endonuclease